MVCLWGGRENPGVCLWGGRGNLLRSVCGDLKFCIEGCGLLLGNVGYLILCVQVEAILSSEDQRSSLATHVDQLLRAVLMQMKMNFTTQFAAASDSEARKVVSE